MVVRDHRQGDRRRAGRANFIAHLRQEMHNAPPIAPSPEQVTQPMPGWVSLMTE